jgi:hypothetical protein
VTARPEYRCVVGGASCPGHANRWMICVNQAWGTPYEYAQRLLLAKQAEELLTVRIRHLEELQAAARRFNNTVDFNGYQKRLTELRERLEHAGV